MQADSSEPWCAGLLAMGEMRRQYAVSLTTQETLKVRIRVISLEDFMAVTEYRRDSDTGACKAHRCAG